MSSLADREKQLLLQIARRALVAAVEQGESLELFSAEETSSIESQDFGGAFVTLHRRQRLRGCIGQLVSDVPLAHVVAYCSRAAALNDPRFRPVAATELSEIDIELSILSYPKEVTPGEIEPGRHGLMVSQGAQRGLLLPQVASQYGWSTERFLQETCIKGGLEANAWKFESTRIQAFTAEVFGEAGAGREEAHTFIPGRPNYSSST